MTTTKPARAAVRSAWERLIPVPVRRVVGFDTKGMVSLALWIARRRHGVPPGATAVPYSGAQTATMLLFLFAMATELVAVELLLRAVDAPAALRAAFLLVDGYSILFVLAVVAACVTRPHVITADEVRIRYGAFFDLRVPRDRIAAARPVRNHNEPRLITADGERLAIAVSAQTNLALDLTTPLTATRPLGRPTTARTIHFHADDPLTALRALRAPRHEEAAPEPNP
ncbi:hypothetical protein GCM10027168_01200 [Streptomyces capparidis]